MRVLICDDDVDVGEFLRTLMELERWETELVTSGEECLQHVAASGAPDVLVLDQMMPGMSGIQTATQLRRQGFDRPIVLCSAHLGPELVEDIEQLDLMPCSKLDSEALLRMVRVSARSARLARRPRRTVEAEGAST